MGTAGADRSPAENVIRRARACRLFELLKDTGPNGTVRSDTRTTRSAPAGSVTPECVHVADAGTSATPCSTRSIALFFRFLK
ncbi:hypothetical protein VT84_09090 [Gemmata sp. SH-PL17]|nr:hypothetical protein VT84_09090 [Gemmata sp. SH-PL17]